MPFENPSTFEVFFFAYQKRLVSTPPRNGNHDVWHWDLQVGFWMAKAASTRRGLLSGHSLDDDPKGVMSWMLSLLQTKKKRPLMLCTKSYQHAFSKGDLELNCRPVICGKNVVKRQDKSPQKLEQMSLLRTCLILDGELLRNLPLGVRCWGWDLCEIHLNFLT